METILIEIESMCLLAGIALRCGMRVVAAHFHQVAAVFAAELDFDAAVALTQNAGCRFPVRGGRGGHNCHLIALLHEKASVECCCNIASLLFWIVGEGLPAVASASYHFSTHGRSTTSNAQVDRCWRCSCR